MQRCSIKQPSMPEFAPTCSLLRAHGAAEHSEELWLLCSYERASKHVGDLQPRLGSSPRVMLNLEDFSLHISYYMVHSVSIFVHMFIYTLLVEL